MLLENNGEKPKATVEQEKNSKKSMLIFLIDHTFLNFFLASTLRVTNSSGLNSQRILC